MEYDATATPTLQFASALQFASTSPLATVGASTLTEPGLFGAVVPGGAISRHALDRLTLAALQTVGFNGGSQSSPGISPTSSAVLPSSKSRKSDVRSI